MDISASDGYSFRLKVAGYLYPETVKAEWDSNWLKIYLAVELPQGAWSVTDAFLLTYEVRSLADWLDAVASNLQSENEIGFVEPNLWFEIIEPTSKVKERYLRIHFALECLPLWVDRSEHGKEDVFADFPLSEIDLRTAVEALRYQLSLYPQRAAH